MWNIKKNLNGAAAIRPLFITWFYIKQNHESKIAKRNERWIQIQDAFT